MGWLYSEGWPTAGAMRDHLRKSLTDSGYEIVKDATTVYGKRYYAAVKKAGVTSLFVALIDSYRRDGTTWFGYKDMDEGMGPVDADCPPSLIAVLSPVEDIYGPVTDAENAAKFATDYRARCLANAAAKKASTASAKTLKPGDKVWFKNVRNNPFTVTSAGKNAKGTFKVLGYDARGNGLYRLPLAKLERVEPAATA